MRARVHDTCDLGHTGIDDLAFVGRADDRREPDRARERSHGRRLVGLGESRYDQLQRCPGRRHWGDDGALVRGRAQGGVVEGLVVHPRPLDRDQVGRQTAGLAREQVCVALRRSRQDAVLLEVGDGASRDRGDPWGGDVIELRRLWYDLVPRRHDRRTHAVDSQRALVGRQDRARRAGAFGVGDHDLHLAHVVGGVLTCVHTRCRKRCARLGRIGRWREGDLVGRLDREARRRHPAEADPRSAGEPRAVDRDRPRRRFQTGVGPDARHARDR